MEKRGQHRVHKRLSVRFGARTLDHHGFTRDISPTGVFVVCHALPPVGTRLQLEILMGPTGWVQRAGIVRRVRQVPQALRHVEQMGFGLSFLPSAQAIASAGDPVAAPPAPEAGVLEARFAAAVDLHGAWQRELKVGGLLIASEQPVHLDERVQVRLRLDFARLALELPARVVQVLAAPTRRVAVAFEDLPGVRRALAPYLAT